MTQDLAKYEVAEEAFNVKTAMDGILAGVVSLYASYNVPLPSRRYWTIGEPVIDCEQVVVSMVQLYLGAPGDDAAAPQPCNGPMSLVVNVSVSREQTTNKSGKAPSAETIQKDAEWAAIDTYILMSSLDALTDWPGSSSAMIATSTVPTPAGGYQTAQTNITMLVP